jgi:hypothetical protein
MTKFGGPTENKRNPTAKMELQIGTDYSSREPLPGF